MSERPRVVVVGGGITGLVTAYRLRERADVTLLEAAPRLGGNIATERRDGFLLDVGPDSWVAAKPKAAALAKELGLEGDLIGTKPDTRKVYVAYHGKLHPLPEGLVLGVPTRIGPMVTTRLFSLLGKARMGLEPMVAAKDWTGADDDEAVYDFVARRLGDEAASRLAGPLLGGFLFIAISGLFFVAIGVFASSVTSNQSVAGILGCVMLATLILGGNALSDSAWLEQGVLKPAKSVIEYAHVFGHRDDFARGVIDTRHLLFYFSGTALALIFSILSVEAKLLHS